jgi:hypothetical protein
MLQVYDRERGTWWSSRVEGAGGENFLNAQEVEALLGRGIEGAGATVVRDLASSPHAPTGNEVAVLAQVFAIQQVRIPEHQKLMRAVQEKVLAVARDILKAHVRDEDERSRRLQKFQPMSKDEEGARMIELAARTSAGYGRFKWTAIVVPSTVPDLCIGSLPALNVTRQPDGRDSVSPGGFFGANFAFLPLTKRLAVKVAAELEGRGLVEADGRLVARLNWASSCFARQLYAPARTIHGVDTSGGAVPVPLPWRVD